MNERLFEAGLIAVALGLFVGFPGYPTALVCLGVFSYLGTCRYLSPPPAKPVEAHDLQAFKEEVANLRSEVGLVKAALGLSGSNKGARPKISVFNQPPQT